jgi:hypothetical protein
MNTDASPIIATTERDRKFVPQFIIMMFVYMFAVYGWSLNLYPLARDFRCMAHPEQLPLLAGALFRVEMGLFHRFVPGYILVNLALLYGCMIAVFFLTRYIVRGPWWLGSLSAVMMMANPLKSEAVLNLSGVQDLLPAFFALLFLACYARNLRYPSTRCRIVAWCVFLLALTFPQNIGLLLLPLVLDRFLCEAPSRRWMPFAVVGLAAIMVHFRTFSWISLSPKGMFAPLFYVLYPLGLLPGTAAFYHAHPMLGWLAGGIVVALFVWLARAMGSPALWASVLAAVCMRFLQGNHLVDDVHLIGGGQLIVAIALVNIAVCEVCRRIIQHPKWLRPMVLITSVACVVLFILQGQVNLDWRAAGHEVAAFQRQSEHPGATPQKDIDAIPDTPFLGYAPRLPIESIRYATPFGPARISGDGLYGRNGLYGWTEAARTDNWCARVFVSASTQLSLRQAELIPAREDARPPAAAYPLGLLRSKTGNA